MRRRCNGRKCNEDKEWDKENKKYLEIEDKVMKEETKEVTYNEYKEEQMRRNRWKGGKGETKKEKAIMMMMIS